MKRHSHSSCRRRHARSLQTRLLGIRRRRVEHERPRGDRDED